MGGLDDFYLTLWSGISLWGGCERAKFSHVLSHVQPQNYLLTEDET